MAPLTSRVSLVGPPPSEPEDFLADSLGVIFPDTVMTQHGDSGGALHYVSPHLAQPLLIRLADPDVKEDRLLFSHFLWNSSLLMAELIEAGSLGLDMEDPVRGGAAAFDVRGLEILELGAGTALPTIMAAHLGARRAVVTDYPADPVIDTLRHNIAHNTAKPLRLSPDGPGPCAVEVGGHVWGDTDTPLALQHRGAFDRVIACDCLWMPGEHIALQQSVAWFLKPGTDARAWVVAGFHTGRAKMAGFFGREALAAVGLEVERIWERDCDGVERDWVEDRGREDTSRRKRWLAVAVLRRVTGEVPVAEDDEEAER